jgi:hypothetical protein
MYAVHFVRVRPAALRPSTGPMLQTLAAQMARTRTQSVQLVTETDAPRAATPALLLVHTQP